MPEIINFPPALMMMTTDSDEMGEVGREPKDIHRGVAETFE